MFLVKTFYWRGLLSKNTRITCPPKIRTKWNTTEKATLKNTPTFSQLSSKLNSVSWTYTASPCWWSKERSNRTGRSLSPSIAGADCWDALSSSAAKCCWSTERDSANGCCSSGQLVSSPNWTHCSGGCRSPDPVAADCSSRLSSARNRFVRSVMGNRSWTHRFYSKTFWCSHADPFCWCFSESNRLAVPNEADDRWCSRNPESRIDDRSSGRSRCR